EASPALPPVAALPPPGSPVPPSVSPVEPPVSEPPVPGAPPVTPAPPVPWPSAPGLGLFAEQPGRTAAAVNSAQQATLAFIAARFMTLPRYIDVQASTIVVGCLEVPKKAHETTLASSVEAGGSRQRTRNQDVPGQGQVRHETRGSPAGIVTGKAE